MNVEFIAKELDFNIEDTEIIIKAISNKMEKYKEKDIIDYWEVNCFRANDFEEIEEYYRQDCENDYEFRSIYNAVYILPSGILAVIW